MKKLLPILFLLGAAALIFQIFVQFFMRHHEIDYSIITKDNSYLIHEKLKVDGKKNTYYFKLVDDNQDTYIFNLEHDYNRQDEIVKDVKYFNDENLRCIFPIFKKGITSDIYCKYKKQQVSYSYLRQTDNSSLDKYINKLKKSGYIAKSWARDTLPKKDSVYDIYRDNVNEDTIFTVWDYRGFYIINNKKVIKKDFLNHDQYENNLSYLTDNYYVSINTDLNSGNMYASFYLYDILNGGKGRVDLDEQISFNMYINGSYDGKFYYTDLNTKKQYALDPDKETVKEVGNVKDGFKSIQGKRLVTVSSKEYLKSNDIWTNDVVNNVLGNMYGAKEVKKSNDMYYFVTDTGDFYKTDKLNLKNSVLLFHFDSVSEWKVKGDNVMVVSGDTMYYYDDVYGLLPIVTSNEFIYNYKNICDFYVK